MQINQINFQTDAFPEQLAEIPSPPKCLFTLGELPSGPYLAIVGTRKPTSYGRHMAYQLASELAAAGFVIVSGLASGIDGVAHQAALDVGGKTLAVLGSGLDRIYPADHRKLATDILGAGGALVSEFPIGTTPFPGNFVARNRIISGLSLGTVFIEGDVKSGAIHTVNFAIKQNRVVMAVPGNATSPMSAGPNNIIREGGVPVTGSIDVINQFQSQLATDKPQPVTAADPREALLTKLLKEGKTTTHDLIAASGLPAGELADVMSLMEISGKLRNLGSGQWAARVRS